MDASNEFKVYLSPSSGSSSKGKKGEGDGSSGVRQRLVPVINKVFSPSHFMLAQRKTTVYKAVSGVSFQDIDIGGKKKWSSGKREKKDKKQDKKDQIYTSASEGERSLQSTRSGSSVKSLLGGKGESRGDARKLRHSLGSHTERPSTFLSDHVEKKDKKTRIRSASRTRSVSATENLYLSQDGETSSENPPVKPQRSRSASRPRRPVTKVNVPQTAKTSTRETNGNSTENEKQDDHEIEKESGDQNNEGSCVNDECKQQDRKTTESKDCEMADEDAYERSRARRKSDRSNKPDNSRDRSKSEPDKTGKDGTKNDDDEEPEGGYFSLEKEEKGGGEIKFIYEALPTNTCEEYMENDQCVEAIYVCQVLRRDSDNDADEDEHIYENYQMIRMTKDGKLITEGDENYENYQIIRRVKEEELLGLPAKTSGEQKNQDDDPYESINFVSQNPLALTQMTATQARLKRQRPLGSIDSIPFIDDSDSSADEAERRNPVSKGLTSKNGVTVITIKEDDNTEITQKESPLRTKPSLLRSQDGSEDSSTLERAKFDNRPAVEREDGVESSSCETAQTSSQSSETSTPKRPTRHSYPAASPFIPRLCDKIGLKLARFSSASEEAGGAAGVKVEGKVEVRVKKSMSHNDVQTHMKGTGPVHSESFSDDDIRHNEEFESFSETDSDLDNLDYDMFAPRGGRAGGHRAHLKHRNKPRGRSLSASHASPQMTSTPYGTNNDSVSSTGCSAAPDIDLQSPKTFQDLLVDKHLNPPDTDAESQSGEGIKFDKVAPLMIHETGDVALRGPQDVVRSTHSSGGTGAEAGDRVILEDTHCFTWSDAESEFEFIDFKKVEPPKTCVVYQGVTVSSSVATATTTTTTGSSTSVRSERKAGSSVKRAQSMKVVGERVSCRGEGSLRWEPLLCVLPEGLTTAHGSGLVRSVSGVSVRRSVRVEGSRYTAASADTPDGAGLRALLDSTGVVAGVQHAGRGSAPSSPQLAASRSAESTPSKFNLFSKLKGKAAAGGKTSAKSIAKADKVAKNGESTIDSSDGSLPLGRSHSHDNIQSPAYPPDHDALCSPLHDRSRSQPNQDETRRTENTLKIWIMEAKGIPNKKKYYCTLKLNTSLYGRTFSKQKSNMCFWGEYFELDLLPQVSTICIELMREADKKSVRKKIGTVEIDLKTSSPSRAALEEHWYPVKVDKQDRDVPALRIKHRFQSVDILPLPQYGPFRQYLKENATSLCQLLEPVVSVKAKEDIATTLINIMQAEDRAIPFLVNLVFTDIQRMAENEHLLFRGNSVATKAIEAYMKLVGEQYLHGTLREPVQALITASEDLEVDPLRITNIQSLHSQRNALKEHVSAIWEKILQSGRNFPVELRHVFHTLRERLSRQEKCELIDNLISSCVFLRFLCPAVLSPSLFNIIKEYPDERAGRNLTLVAKILQTLANFTHFQGKENFMEFLNDFIHKEQERCRTFLRTISSSLSEEDSTLEFDGKIDLGKHLALLHLHLADALAKLNTQGCESEASKVLALVDDVSTLLGRDYSEAPIVSQPVPMHTLVCTPPLVSNPSLLTTPSHINNNYTREDCVDGLVENPMSMGLVGGGGAGLSIPSTTTMRSQSLPRAVTPIYSQHQMASGSPGANFYRDKTAANDLSTNDEYVLITAFDHRTEPQNYMYPSVEANNNTAPMTDMRLSNGNTYYMTEVAPPGSPLRQGGSPGPHHPEIIQQSLRSHLHTPHQSRLHPRATTMSSRSHSVTGVPTPIERRGLYQDECSALYNYMDSCSHQINALCMDSENNIQGSQTSISQLSNIASSGYQSFAYSQSSSPVDPLLHADNSSLLSRENGNPVPPGFRQALHGSPLASPLHQPVASKHRAVAVHPAHLGHTGHVSLHGTPRHIPRVPQPKGSPNSSLSSSQSVEDLSSLRRGRTRQRRSASSSSDSSPDTRPSSHTHAHSRRPHAHPPRTNPHCSPHLVPSPALRQEHRSRSRHDRSVSGRRGRNYRSCDREDFPRGTTHCYEDSEDDVSVVTRSSGGAGVGSWMKDVRHISQDEYHLPHNMAPQQLLDQQEDQMRAIVERLMSMEQEFRHEQEVMRREMHDKDARIDAQAKKIAALDTANTHLIRTIASLSSRSGEMKNELPGDLNIDSCNASDTSDYKSSSC